MARLVGVDLPRDKRLEVALTYIYGIGRTRALQTLGGMGYAREYDVERYWREARLMRIAVFGPSLHPVGIGRVLHVIGELVGAIKLGCLLPPAFPAP